MFANSFSFLLLVFMLLFVFYAFDFFRVFLLYDVKQKPQIILVFLTSSSLTGQIINANDNKVCVL